MANLRQNTTIGGAIAANSKNILSIIKSIDGHGSGIDADLLDGRHASEFSLTSHNHDSQYVKKSGDTMTGNLIFNTASGTPIRINCYISGGWARGIGYYKQNETSKHGSIGLFGSNDEPTHFFMGFGEEAWLETNAFTVSQTEIKYKGNKVWHSANDGAGSGLDADMVDGIQSSRIVYGDTDSGTCSAPSNITLGRIIKSGFYTYKGATDTPDGTDSYWWLLNVADRANDVQQNKFGLQVIAKNRTSDFYMRTVADNGGTWRKLWHNGNMGSGSGLDADKIDGKHWSDIESTFVKKSGDTMTGTLCFNSGTDKGIRIGNVKIDAVNPNNLAIRNLNELRFGSNDDWEYNSWAGIKYITSAKKLYIGGPGNNFSNNPAPPSIEIDLANNVNRVYIPELQINPKVAPKMSPQFSNASTHQCAIFLPPAPGSNDPGRIVFETGTGADSNRCVLHLCPGDDQQPDDYVAVHGVGQAENIKLSTVGNIDITRQFISRLGTGTAPIVVSSRTKCENLNADLLDDKDSSVEATANTIPVRDGNGDLKVAKKLIANAFEMIYDDSTESVNFVFK